MSLGPRGPGGPGGPSSIFNFMSSGPSSIFTFRSRWSKWSLQYIYLLFKVVQEVPLIYLLLVPSGPSSIFTCMFRWSRWSLYSVFTCRSRWSRWSLECIYLEVQVVQVVPRVYLPVDPGGPGGPLSLFTWRSRWSRWSLQYSCWQISCNRGKHSSVPLRPLNLNLANCALMKSHLGNCTFWNSPL